MAGCTWSCTSSASRSALSRKPSRCWGSVSRGRCTSKVVHFQSVCFAVVQLNPLTVGNCCPCLPCSPQCAASVRSWPWRLCGTTAWAPPCPGASEPRTRPLPPSSRTGEPEPAAPSVGGTGGCGCCGQGQETPAAAGGARHLWTRKHLRVVCSAVPPAVPCLCCFASWYLETKQMGFIWESNPLRPRFDKHLTTSVLCPSLAVTDLFDGPVT